MDSGHMLRISGLLATMRVNQWKSCEELEALQLERLKECVAYASAHAPHYRKSLAGRRVRDLDDFRALPILSKEEVRSCPESFISSNFPVESLVRMHTSGSSGIPLTVYHSRAESAYGPAFEIHQMLEAGVGPLDTHAVITKSRPPFGILNRLGFFRRYPVEYRNAGQAVRDIAALRPTVIRGTPSFLVPIAHENITSGLGLRTKRAFTFSEVLSQNGRAMIERSLGCRVFDSYGSIETSWISWECEKGGIHAYSDQLFAEVVDQHGNPLPPGREGSLVLTPLWRRAMPFIRYNLGDRTAIMGRCRCGRGYGTLKAVEGRNNDFIVLPSGSLCSAHVISFNIRSFPGILQFQSRQEKGGEIALLVLPAAGISPLWKQELKKIVEAALPERMDVRVEEADHIPRTQNGKACDFYSAIRPRI